MYENGRVFEEERKKNKNKNKNKKKKQRWSGSEEERKIKKKKKMPSVMSGSDLTTHKLWSHKVLIFTLVPLRISSQFLKTPNCCFLFSSL